MSRPGSVSAVNWIRVWEKKTEFLNNTETVGCLNMQGSREEWKHVFFICSGFYVFSTIVYVLLASGVEQPWAKSKDAEAAVNERLTTQL